MNAMNAISTKGIRVVTPINPYTKFKSFEEMIDRTRSIKALEVAIDSATLWRTNQNPLAALATLAGLSTEKAAEIAGVTVEQVEQENLIGRLDRIERAIGRLALATLARLRGQLRTVAIGGRNAYLDDPIEEVLGLSCRLMNNKAFANHKEGDTVRFVLVKA